LTAKTRTQIDLRFVERFPYRVALLTLSPPAGKAAVLHTDTLRELSRVLTRLDWALVDALAITGTGPIFCAGADLDEVISTPSSAAAEAIARQGLDTFEILDKLPVPTFSFLNGTTLGGGLELALNTDWRIAAASVKAIGFPEVRLGLIPGWGGIWRMVDLVGAAKAQRMIVSDSLQGTYCTAHSAAALGFVDRVAASEDFLEESLDYVVSVLDGTEAVQARTPPAVEDSKESLAAGRDPGGAAALRAQGLILAAEAGTSTLLRNEQAKVFGELAVSGEARLRTYASRAIAAAGRQSLRRGGMTAVETQSVGIVGAGLMARQIALLFAEKFNSPVVINDLSQDRITAAVDWIRRKMARNIRPGNDLRAAEELISGSTDIHRLAACDVVVEAVFEELDVKKSVFAQLEAVVRPDALLLTNTSSISIEEISAGLAYPGRFMGFHFFNPVSLLSLLEVIPSTNTDNATRSAALALAAKLQKTPIEVRDSPGFVVNRVLTRLMCATLSEIDGGADPEAVEHALHGIGLPMTPLRLLQFIGPAVQLHITQIMNRSFPDRFPVSPSLISVVDAGLPGYLDSQGEMADETKIFLMTRHKPAITEVRRRILSAVADEVERMINDGVVSGPQEIDVCMILGANFPLHTGGLTPLLDQLAGTNFHQHLHIKDSTYARL
jgi:3-hydroxyacyl-CoA dehydrogenase/enoyl-CoA hydratase/carnithine racemase